MKVAGKAFRTIRLADDGWAVEVIDQSRLPHAFELQRLETLEDAVRAIQTMVVRGAPLVGMTAAYGMCLAARACASARALTAARERLLRTRPTAVNLRWALDQMVSVLEPLPDDARAGAAYRRAAALCDEDVSICSAIGDHGRILIERGARPGGGPVRVLTHCNAGWLAAVDWGTALAPIYKAHDAGIAVHVWVDETRPRNQGAALTAWELAQHGVPHTLVVDSASGHLMQRGLVDLCLVGADRVTAAGDVCNKIGTYLKALAARECGIPFYAAAPSPSIDFTMDDWRDIPIEERHGDEVRRVAGRADDGRVIAVLVAPPDSPVANPAFDVTPARLVTGLVTERGTTDASAAGLGRLYPDRSR